MKGVPGSTLAHMYTAFGLTLSLTGWEKNELCVVGRKTLQRRLEEGWKIEDALTTPARTMHGEHKSRLNKLWRSMRKRCKTPSSTGYAKYGAKGIEVCKEWDDYLTFKKWALENGYTDDLTIHRKNRKGNYEPDNCEWLPWDEHAKKDKVGVELPPKKLLTAWGETKSRRQWVKDGRCPHKNSLLLKDRLRHGWSPEDAISIPKDVGGRDIRSDKYTAWGETKSIRQWLEDKRCKCHSEFALYARFHSNYWTPEQAITTPVPEPEERAKLIGEKKANKYECWGEEKTLNEWVKDKRCKATRSALYQRLVKGIDIEVALTTPSYKGNKFNKGAK